MMAVAEERLLLRAGLGERARRLAESAPGWLGRRRAAALARFEERGFPTTREEAWRKTSVAPIARTAFRPADAPRDAGAAVAAASLPGSGEARIVFVNGRHVPELSSPAPAGVEALSLRGLLARDPDRLSPLLGEVLGDRGHVFADLNTALFEDGAAVLVAPGAAPAVPVHLVHVSTGGDGEPAASFPRTLVVAGRGSEATVVESYRGPGGAAYLTVPVSEALLEDGARLDHYRLQDEGDAAFHVSTFAVRQGRDTGFTDHSISLGAALSRHDLDQVFAGEGGECTLNGLFLADGTRHTDTHTRIDHAVPHCASRELYKGVLDGSARGVFDGLIVVRKGAQKTDAWQTNKNLLLSRQALVDSTPRLEILADDVKCRHGSTTGQLDPGALFYLRSRGISEAAARSLLIYAFASDLVHRLRVESLRRAVEAHLRSHLAGAREVEEALP